MLRALPIALALLAAAVPVNAVHAAMACMPTKTVRELLARQYGERPAVLGITSTGRVMVLYRNPAKRSWSIVVYTATGLGCLIQSGSDLRFRREPKGKPS